MNAKILINQQNLKTENPQLVDNSLNNKHYRKTIARKKRENHTGSCTF